MSNLKGFIVLSAILIVFTVSAQDTLLHVQSSQDTSLYEISSQDTLNLIVQDQDILKHTAGRKSLELQFSPFSSSNPISISGIRFRVFKSKKTAYRVTAFFRSSNNSGIKQQENGDISAKELKTKTNRTVFSIKPGFESHFKGTNKLSPYIGAELDFGITNTTQTEEFQNGDQVLNSVTKNPSGNQSFLRLGANLLAGFDYYIAKDIYLGAEFGFGFTYTNFTDTKKEFSDSDFFGPDPEDTKNGSFLDIGPNAMGEIRLGFLL